MRWSLQASNAAGTRTSERRPPHNRILAVRSRSSFAAAAALLSFSLTSKLGHACSGSSLSPRSLFVMVTRSVFGMVLLIGWLPRSCVVAKDTRSTVSQTVGTFPPCLHSFSNTGLVADEILDTRKNGKMESEGSKSPGSCRDKRQKATRYYMIQVSYVQAAKRLP